MVTHTQDGTEDTQPISKIPVPSKPEVLITQASRKRAALQDEEDEEEEELSGAEVEDERPQKKLKAKETGSPIGPLSILTPF